MEIEIIPEENYEDEEEQSPVDLNRRQKFQLPLQIAKSSQEDLLSKSGRLPTEEELAPAQKRLLETARIVSANPLIKGLVHHEKSDSHELPGSNQSGPAVIGKHQ